MAFQFFNPKQPIVGGLAGQALSFLANKVKQQAQPVPQRPVQPQRVFQPTYQQATQVAQNVKPSVPIPSVRQKIFSTGNQLGKEITQADYNIRTKVFGFGPNLQPPSIPPSFQGAGAGLQKAFENAPMLTRAGNAVLGQAGKIKLGPKVASKIPQITKGLEGGGGIPVQPKGTITQPKLTLEGSKGINKVFQDFANKNPNEPLVTDNKSQRLYQNISDAIQQKRVNVEDIPYFKQLGYTNNDYQEVAETFRTVSRFSGQTLNELSKTAKFIGNKLPDVITKQDNMWDKVGRVINNIVNIQGAALVSNVYTAARNAMVATGKLPIQAIDDAIAGMAEVVTGKATPKVAFAPLFEDFASILRVWTPKENQALQKLFEKYPVFKQQLLGTPVSEVTMGSKVANALTVLNKFQDNVFTKIRFDAIVRGQMGRYGVQNMDQLPSNVLNQAVKDALKFTFRGSPESVPGKAFVNLANHKGLGPILKLGLFRFPRFMALAMEHTFNYSPAGFVRLFSPNFQKQLISQNPRTAYQALAQATTGSMLLALGVNIRGSDMAGDKWYEIKLPNGKILDARGFQPLSSYLFMGEIANRGLKNMNGQDVFEGALGINRVAGTGLVLLDAIRSKNPEDTIKKIGSDFVGQFLAGFTVPLRQVSLGLATTGNEQEQIVRSTKEGGILTAAQANIPGLRNQLPALPSATTKGPVKTEFPGARLAGISLSQPDRIKRELSSMGLGSKDITPKTGEPQVDRFITEVMGTGVEKLGQKLSPRFSSLSPQQKKQLLLGQKGIITKIRGEAKKRALVIHAEEIAQNFNSQLQGNSEEKQREIIDKWKTKGLLTPQIKQQMMLQRSGQ